MLADYVIDNAANNCGIFLQKLEPGLPRALRRTRRDDDDLRVGVVARLANGY